MNILITICARGGSKGIPGKNIKLLNGKPLIYYTLRTATEFAALQRNCRIVLSTDSQEIKETVGALSFPLVDLSYTRPARLADDSAGKVDAIADVVAYAQRQYACAFDYVLDLDVTSPLRSTDDLHQAFLLLRENKQALNLFSVSPAARNPYFNMVEERGNGFVSLCKEGNFRTRQSAPKVYDMNASFYLYTAEFFAQKCSSAITERSIVYEVPHLCFDLDHPIDFLWLEFLITHNQLDFPWMPEMQ